MCSIVETDYYPNQAFHSIVASHPGSSTCLQLPQLALVPSWPGGPVFAFRAAFASFARSSQCLTAPEPLEALNPKTESNSIAIVLVYFEKLWCYRFTVAIVSQGQVNLSFLWVVIKKLQFQHLHNPHPDNPLILKILVQTNTLFTVYCIPLKQSWLFFLCLKLWLN